MQGWDDSGLLGVAFHPGFVTNRFMFCWYTWVTPGTVLGNQNTRPPTSTPNRMRLARFTLDANNVVVPGTETVFINQDAQTVWHEGGGLFFGDDGYLYLTIGDDSIGSNNHIITQSLFSGVIRIDVDRRGGSISHAIPKQPVNGVTTNYFVPNDNPSAGQADVLEEFTSIETSSSRRTSAGNISSATMVPSASGCWMNPPSRRRKSSSPPCRQGRDRIRAMTTWASPASASMRTVKSTCAR